MERGAKILLFVRTPSFGVRSRTVGLGLGGASRTTSCSSRDKLRSQISTNNETSWCLKQEDSKLTRTKHIHTLLLQYSKITITINDKQFSLSYSTKDKCFSHISLKVGKSGEFLGLYHSCHNRTCPSEGAGDTAPVPP